MSSLATTPTLTIGEYLTHLLPRLRTSRRIPSWPPDVFALCMALLQKSGGYAHALAQWPPGRPNGSIYDSAAWTEYTYSIGKRWRKAWIHGQKVPSRVQELWRELVNAWDKPTREFLRGSDGGKLLAAVLELAVLADQASEGVGVAGYTGQSGEQIFYNQADQMLQADANGSTVCCEIDKSRARVLPKMHTPQNGLTIRSLSLHLALCCGDEITPSWSLSGTWASPLTTSSLNLLLVPWPLLIQPSQFTTSEPRLADVGNFPRRYKLFTYRPNTTAVPALELVTRMEQLLKSATEVIGRVDMVVLPECSLTQAMYDQLSQLIRKKKAPWNSEGAIFIAGVVAEGDTSSSPSNQVFCDIPGRERTQQAKHHRWCLNTSQIEQYGIGSQLDPEMTWWEHIDLQRRSITFLSMMPWLVLSVLICEDLARPDPAGDLIRAVGPNLVIALLMDGPQIRERWSARYATTLADDPGSSVLTLTSAGMSLLSRPLSGTSRSGRMIALWKDAKRSTPVEIELPDGYDGVVLSLTPRWLEEFTADGRSDGGSAGYPVLSGMHPVRVNPHPINGGIY